MMKILKKTMVKNPNGFSPNWKRGVFIFYFQKKLKKTKYIVSLNDFYRYYKSKKKVSKKEF